MKLKFIDTNSFIKKNEVEKLLSFFSKEYTENINEIIILKDVKEERKMKLKDNIKIIFDNSFYMNSKFLMFYFSFLIFYNVSSAVYKAKINYTSYSEIILNSLYNLESLLMTIIYFLLFTISFFVISSFFYKGEKNIKGSYNPLTKKLFIYLNVININNNKTKKEDFVITLFHELRHSYQNYLDNTIDIKEADKDYINYLNSKIEIDANNFSFDYSIKKYKEISNILNIDEIDTLFFFKHSKLSYDEHYYLVNLEDKRVNNNLSIGDIFKKIKEKQTIINLEIEVLFKEKIQLEADKKCKNLNY